MSKTWTADECAAAWGVKPPTWLGYVSRGQAPQPLPGYDEQRRRRWDAETVRAHKRPGRGHRTDLEGQGMTTAERPRVGRRCAACRRDMLNSDGCVERPGCITPLQEWDMLAALPSWADCLPPKPVEPCRDCGTPPGGFHHLLCCKAFCSLHNNQRLQCGCDRRP